MIKSVTKARSSAVALLLTATLGTDEDGGMDLHSGFYSMLSLSEGCEDVITFDPQPSCVRHIKHAFVRNGFEKGVIIPHLVDHISGQSDKLDASLNCAESWPVQQYEAGSVDPDNILDVRTTTLSEVLPEDLHISLAKVDTEGAEYRVLLWSVI
jgi:FkbM family methyltransferase